MNGIKNIEALKPAFSCSKPTTETPEPHVKYVQSQH